MCVCVHAGDELNVTFPGIVLVNKRPLLGEEFGHLVRGILALLDDELKLKGVPVAYGIYIYILIRTCQSTELRRDYCVPSHPVPSASLEHLKNT